MSFISQLLTLLVSLMNPTQTADLCESGVSEAHADGCEVQIAQPKRLRRTSADSDGNGPQGSNPSISNGF